MIIRPTVPRMPRIEVYERMLSGTNDNGINIMKENNFHDVAETVGTSAFSESANRTTRATHVAVSSREKRTETMIRCLLPKASLEVSEMGGKDIPADICVGDQTWINLHTSCENSCCV